MKDMIFSAVALVAFSFAGMANNGEVEKKEVKITIIKTPQCDAAGREAFNVVRDLGGTFQQCVDARVRVTKACEDKITEL
jgi:hypothetical protein